MKLWTVLRLWWWWRKEPHLRLGQFIDNSIFHGRVNLFYIDDAALIERVSAFVKERNK